MQDCADADEDAVVDVAVLVDATARGLVRDPLRCARARRDLAVERHRRLERDERHLLGHPLEEGLVEPSRLFLEDAADDLDAGILENLDAAARDERVRVLHRDDAALHASLGHRLGAGARAAVVRTRLERHVERRTLRELPCHAQSVDLRMRRAGLAVPACGDDAPAAHDDGADHRVWRRPPLRIARELQRLTHEIFILHLPSPQTMNPVLFDESAHETREKSRRKILFRRLAYMQNTRTCLFSSRLYGRLRNLTGSCPETSGLAGSTAGGEMLPASKTNL